MSYKTLAMMSNTSIDNALVIYKQCAHKSSRQTIDFIKNEYTKKSRYKTYAIFTRRI